GTRRRLSPRRRAAGCRVRRCRGRPGRCRPPAGQLVRRGSTQGCFRGLNMEEMTMKRALTAGIAALAVTLTGLPAVAADIRIGLQEDPDILDPHEARTFVGRIVFNLLCDKLVDTNEKLEFVPRIATS